MSASGLPESPGQRRLAALARRVVACRACPRLVVYLAETKRRWPDFWCRPVPGFGDTEARLVIVGLAPGRRGSNRTARMFTGDASGVWLFRVLYDTGFSPRERSDRAGDGLVVKDCWITAAARCAPPGNKPLPSELDACRPFLAEELRLLAKRRVLLALGKIGHDAVLKTYGVRLSALPFSHGALHTLPDGRLLLDCYHCSRQNTQTGKLSWPMFVSIFRHAVSLLQADRTGDPKGHPRSHA